MNFSAAQTQNQWDTTATSERPASLRPATVLIRHVDFVGCIDACVQSLLTESQDASANLDAARLQLREWLGGDTQILESGAAIDAGQFDTAILSIEERLPQAGPQDQARLLRASRALAEAIYSKT